MEKVIDLSEALAASAANDIDEAIRQKQAEAERELTVAELADRIAQHRKHFLQIISAPGFVGAVLVGANEQTGYSVVAFGLSPEQVALAGDLVKDMNRQSFGAAAVKPRALAEIGG